MTIDLPFDQTKEILYLDALVGGEAGNSLPLVFVRVDHPLESGSQRRREDFAVLISNPAAFVAACILKQSAAFIGAMVGGGGLPLLCDNLLKGSGHFLCFNPPLLINIRLT